MQCAVIEYGRNVCGLAGASSSEFDPAAPHLVIDLLPEQRGVADKGGTMRLGVHPIALGEGSPAPRLLVQGIIPERPHHLYVVTNAYPFHLGQTSVLIPVSFRAKDESA